MKKEWMNPEVKDLTVKMTEKSPKVTQSQDGTFTDPDGNLWISFS